MNSKSMSHAEGWAPVLDQIQRSIETALGAVGRQEHFLAEAESTTGPALESLPVAADQGGSPETTEALLERVAEAERLLEVQAERITRWRERLEKLRHRMGESAD